MIIEKQFIEDLNIVPLVTAHRRRRQSQGGGIQQEAQISFFVLEGGSSTPQEAVNFLSDKVIDKKDVISGK